MRNKSLLFILFVFFVFSACNTSQLAKNNTSKIESDSKFKSAKLLNAASKMGHKLKTHQAGFYYKVLTIGEPVDSLYGKMISFNYKLETLNSALIYDSFVENEPLIASYDDLIPIIQETLLLAGKKGQSISFVPGNKFYNYKGVGEIPANQDIIMTISLVGVQSE